MFFARGDGDEVGVSSGWVGEGVMDVGLPHAVSAKTPTATVSANRTRLTTMVDVSLIRRLHKAACPCSSDNSASYHI